MSILYEKTRLKGRMFRGGYEGEGTGIDAGGNDGPGSGWGGVVGPPEAPANSKPGEDGVSRGGANQVNSVSDRDFGAMTGFNEANPTQTVDQIQASETMQGLLSWGVPAAMSAAVPGAGLAMSLAKTGGKIANGMSPLEAVADYAAGAVNSVANKMTGGAYGMAQTAGAVSKALGGPSVPNVGKEVVSALGGGSSGKSYAGGETAAPNAPGSEGGGIIAAAQQQAAQASAAPSSTSSPTYADADFRTLGAVDSAGWTRALSNYREAKNV